MKYHVHKYQLQPSHRLNALTGAGLRAGALIRWQGETSDDWIVADLLPFPELGQQNLEEQLQNLRQGRPSAMLASALDLAESETQWKKQRPDLLGGLSEIENHLLIKDLATVTESTFAGYSVAKVKLGNDLVNGTNLLQKVSSKFQMKWRFDFNNSLTEKQFFSWYQGLAQHLKDSIEFIEDPFPYEASAWVRAQQELGVTLALDQQLSRLELGPEFGPEFSSAGFEVVVFKPSWDWARRAELLSCGKKVVVTHAMESEWGSYLSVLATCELKQQLQERMLVCGLQRDGIYSNSVLPPMFVAQEGAGLRACGKFESLRQLSWELL